MIRRITLGLLIIASILSPQVIAVNQVSAVNTSGFDAGRVIDDAVFYDPGGMGSVADIQAFLNSHVPACDTNGSQPSGYGNLTRAQYAQQVMGWPGPPYVCLNNYYENPSTGETSFERGGGAFNGGISAAQIIYDAAQEYRINPKVLLITLRKESLNLFSDSWPMKSQYRYAMGYACPDSGPNYSAACVESKAGFYNQMTLAAWQLRHYYDVPSSLNYIPGQWNTIAYNPDPVCGTKDVYIQNYATASLYTYTPYTPNDAALNAYPGTAHCGAYGMRNFYFYWQEWFGSTLINGNFLRSVNNATVYLVGDQVKYPVADPALIGAASGLGGVGFVSQSYLDNIPTGSLLGRTIKSPDGTIYFYDSNIKLPFTSCTMVAAYGSACGAAAALTQTQVDKLVNGPVVTNGMKTTSGKTFYITGGEKREVFDDASLTGAGLSTGYNVLTDSAFNYLTYGTPYVRTNTIIRSRQDVAKQVLNVGSQIYQLKSSQYTNATFSSLASGRLDDQSINKLPVAAATLDDMVKDELGNIYLFTSEGKKQVPDPVSFPVPAVQLPSSLLGQLNGSGSLSNPSLIKSATDATVYVIVNGQKRPLVAMEDLKSITGKSSPYIAWTSGGAVESIPTGNIIVGAGRLVKTPSSATVYMSDGYDKLVPMSTFEPASDAGLTMSIRTISESILSKYTVESTVLLPYISCGGVNYIAMAGTIYNLTLNNTTAKVLQPQTCNVLSKSSNLPRFVRTSDGTINELKDGVLYPISSWSTYTSMKTSGDDMVNITYSTSKLFPRGDTL
jgi:hypothetical protein